MNKTGRLLILISIAVFMLSCKEDHPKSGLLPSPGIEPEEYAVYSSFIEGENSERTYDEDVIVVIENTTKPIVVSDDPNWIGFQGVRREGSYLRNFDKWISISEIGKDTLEDFERKNLYPSTLGYHFDLKVKYLLLSYEESLELARNSNYWEQFYTRYPDSRGTNSFSRVGFNSDKTKAVVYHEWGVGPLAAAGRFFFLIKVDKEWIIKKYIALWIS